GCARTGGPFVLQTPPGPILRLTRVGENVTVYIRRSEGCSATLLCTALPPISGHPAPLVPWLPPASIRIGGRDSTVPGCCVCSSLRFEIRVRRTPQDEADWLLHLRAARALLCDRRVGHARGQRLRDRAARVRQLPECDRDRERCLPGPDHDQYRAQRLLRVRRAPRLELFGRRRCEPPGVLEPGPVQLRRHAD